MLLGTGIKYVAFLAPFCQSSHGTAHVVHLFALGLSHEVESIRNRQFKASHAFRTDESLHQKSKLNHYIEGIFVPQLLNKLPDLLINTIFK